MKVLVTGSEGMLGRAVVRRFSGSHTAEGVDLEQGDLTDPKVVAGMLDDCRPDWVVHCAAWTAVDAAEDHPQQALAANAEATANLADSCGRLGCGLTYISTDYVFDGQGQGFAEDDPRRPINHYGVTKARGEEVVEGLTSPWQIVRTSWLFGDGRVNFVKTIAGLLAKRDTLRVVSDQIGCPTYSEDLAGILEFLVSGRHRGIFHGTNRGHCSWFQFARLIAQGLATEPDRIIPCGTSEYPTAATRPPCSVLLSRRLEAAGCPDRPTWQDAVSRYLALLDSGQAAHPLA